MKDKINSENNKVEDNIISFTNIGPDNKVDTDSTEELDINMTEDELNSPVNRREFIEVLQQYTDNFNEVVNYLMDDMNTLYAKQLFPFQIYSDILVDLLIENGITTREDIVSRYNFKIKELQDKAVEIKNNENWFYHAYM